MKKKYSAAQLKAIRYRYWLRSQRLKKIDNAKAEHRFKLIGKKTNIKPIKKVDAFEKLVDEHKRNRTYQIKVAQMYDRNYKDYINFVYDNAKERDHIIATAKRAGYIPLRVFDKKYDKDSMKSWGTPKATLFIKAKTEKEAIEVLKKTKLNEEFEIVDKDPVKAAAQGRKFAREVEMRNRELDQYDIEERYQR